MVANTSLKLQQFPLGVALPGFWKLAPERAFTLSPGEAGILRVAQGQIWATLDGPHNGPANDWGDVVLHSGEQLQLQPGQHVVVESYGDAVNEPAYFSWEPAAAATSVVVPVEESGWRELPASPGMLAGRAMQGMAAVLARIAGAASYFIAGRGRVLSPLESNQP